MAERAGVRSTLAPFQPIYAGELFQVSFSAEIKGSGAAGTAPEIGELLQACAMAETIDPGVSVIYKPVTDQSSQKSITIYFYRSGKLFKVVGARGTAALEFPVGKPAMANFTFTGHLVSESDAAIVTPVYSSQIPPVMINLSSFTVDTESPNATTISIDLGNEVAQPEDITQANGYGEIRIAGRRVSGSIDFQDKTVADYDFLSKWQTNATFAIDTGAIGSAGNQIRAQVGKAAWTEQSPGDLSGIVTRNMSFIGLETSGDDEVTLTFT
jgi:hypothetical protein